MQAFAPTLQKQIRPILSFLFWSAAFGIGFTQWPLYSENQNTKFLHGLARAGFGTLQEDWLANTIDPLPVFSAIVFVTARFLHPSTFYLYHALLLGLYLYSLNGIANQLFQLERWRAGQIIFMTLVISLHSGLLPPFSIQVLGNSLSWLMQSGVAGQYLFNPVFQPSTLGVLLIFSIYLFLLDRPFAATAAAALATWFHSTYLPSAAVLTLAYMVIVFQRRGRLGAPLAIGLLALSIVAPVLLYNALWLGPTSPELWAESQAIIVDDRIPHHSLPSVWLDAAVYVKIALIVTALFFVRKSALFVVMALSLAIAITLTLLQIETGWDTLAFIAPWRISAFLTPLATAMIVAGVIAFVLQHGQLSATAEWVAIALSLLLLSATVARGYGAVWNSFEARWGDSVNRLYDFVKQDTAPGDLYMAPTGMADFRLATLTPMVVTWKSHPYKDREVIEWKTRVDAVNRFYGEPFCHRAGEMHHDYGVTHIIFEGDNPMTDCPIVKPVYRDDRFAVLEIQ